MSEPAPESPPEQGGFFTRAEHALLPHLEHGEAEAEHVLADAAALARDHAGQVYSIAGELMTVLKLIDPADAALFTAAEAFLPKLFALVMKVTADAQAAHGAS